MKKYTILLLIIALSKSLISCGSKEKKAVTDTANPIPVTVGQVMANGTEPPGL